METDKDRIAYNTAFHNFFTTYHCSLERIENENKPVIAVTCPNPTIDYPEEYMGFKVAIKRNCNEVLAEFKNQFEHELNDASLFMDREGGTIVGRYILIEPKNQDFKFPKIYKGLEIIVIKNKVVTF